MVLEVDGGSVADGEVGGGVGDKAEDDEGVVGLVCGGGKGGLGAAAEVRKRGEGVKETLGEGV